MLFVLCKRTVCINGIGLLLLMVVRSTSGRQNKFSRHMSVADLLFHKGEESKEQPCEVSSFNYLLCQLVVGASLLVTMVVCCCDLDRDRLCMFTFSLLKIKHRERQEGVLQQLVYPCAFSTSVCNRMDFCTMS
jgi:hypothetical protein